MAEAANRSLGQEINSWVQTIGIVIAAAWGGWTFVYKEIVVPKSAPVNVTVDLELKKIGGAQPGVNKKKLIPVQLKVSAKNPSSREIYLLPSVWMASGVKVTSKEHALDDVPVVTSHNEESFSQRHAEVTESVIVATGGLVEDDSLKPNEVTARTFIFYVPQNEYDYLDLATIVPTIARKGAVDLEWKLNNQTGQLEPTWYRLDAKGARGNPMSSDEASAYATANKLELQRSITRATLLLSQ
jgi:hypothetical protein